MERKDVIIKLRTLRLELDDILDAEVPVALILSDVCDALELSQAEHDFVLGKEAARFVEEWKSARMWIPAQRETTAIPLKELAAVPIA